MLENYLVCPKCKEKLVKIENSYKCLNNHSFDISKEGYVNLLLSKSNAGDNDLLIKSRHNFLNKGYYEDLAHKLKEIILQQYLGIRMFAGEVGIFRGTLVAH